MNDQPQNPGIHCKIHTAFIAGLCKQILNVALDRVRGDMQILRDLLICQITGQIPQHLQFPLRQIEFRHFSEFRIGRDARID